MATFQKFAERSKYFPYGYLVSQEAWLRYHFDHFPLDRSATRSVQRVQAARLLADRVNAHRDFAQPGTQPARAGEVLAMGLLTDILRYVATLYCAVSYPGVAQQGIEWVRQQTNDATVERPAPMFVGLYPPLSVREGTHNADDFLRGASAALTHREAVALEMILLRLSVENTALKHYRELFDDTALEKACGYCTLIEYLHAFFSTQPPFPDTDQTLDALLRAPMKSSPDSIMGQLDYIRTHWRTLLPMDLLEELELAHGVLKEENAMRGLGPGPLEALRFGIHGEDMGYEEFEAFSVDKDWMPNLVLIAKCVYVWLDQLSKKHERHIHRLDQIPNEELDRLARWGFTGLWLIGLWERSEASRTIKRIMGNPEAAASAYSLYDYDIAADLGGEEAYLDLKQRAEQRGIRLASDMVPNHMGIYSRWVIEHPDWFVQSTHPPFPGYQFTGTNLSSDERVGLYIEDGYWEHRDAAVVFKRVDHWTGDTRYIYHGNDGTSMPWNDTAQLNFMLPEVREAVAQTILHVARKFSVIRFDAAMTLAKRHYQRLWFPKPGDAGAIPSRAEHGMSKAEFDAAFPKEFWRDVVDRVAQEAPDTLLLAEAFWLMEGYFVRTLGMHRVYNSAFMNMLKMEDNAKYRQTIKNVLEFSPEVLQRFVNFMNNPDEDTAEAQFGKGDKYIGVAALMVTMPGLPMFGHGQIEGFCEKYGMEYRRAYWDEKVDEGLVYRHEREIFPLMRKRHLFSGAHQFAFFDFETPEGWVDENVYAYANRSGDEGALVVYNNAYQATRGSLRMSTPSNKGAADQPELHRLTPAEALQLNTSETTYYICRDYRTGLEYLHYARDIAAHGLYFELSGYQYYALLDWREVNDFDCSWGRLHGKLNGAGVPSVQEAYLEMNLASIIEPFCDMMTGKMLAALLKAKPTKKTLTAFRKAMSRFLEAIDERLGTTHDIEQILQAMEADLARVHAVYTGIAMPDTYDALESFLNEPLAKLKTKADKEAFWRVPVAWSVLRHIGAMAAPETDAKATFDEEATSGAWLQEWLLVKQLAKAFHALDNKEWEGQMDARLVRLCIAYAPKLPLLETEPWAPMLSRLLHDADTQAFLQVNYFGGVTWFNKERFEQLVHRVYLAYILRALAGGAADADECMLCLENLRILCDAAEDAQYNLYALIDSLK